MKKYIRKIQPPQCQPKVDDLDLVDRVHILYYDAGRTQVEVGRALALSQHVIHDLMRRNGFRSRVAAKRDQRGQRNASWRTVPVTYAAYHKRVEAEFGLAKDGLCECGKPAKDWANLTGHYEDVTDFARMCRACHRNYDDRRRDPSTGRYV